MMLNRSRGLGVGIIVEYGAGTYTYAVGERTGHCSGATMNDRFVGTACLSTCEHEGASTQFCFWRKTEVHFAVRACLRGTHEGVHEEEKGFYLSSPPACDCTVTISVKGRIPWARSCYLVTT